MNFYLLFLLAGILTVPQEEKEYPLMVQVTNIERKKGNLKLAVYTDKESFNKDKYFKYKVIPKGSITDGTLNVELLLPEGTYGIALLDDENDNDVMDYHFFIPVEGYGFSNYYHTGMLKPTFEDFKFIFSGPKDSVKIKVKYL